MAVFLTDILSNWSHHFMYLNLSSDLFYTTLEKNLKELDMPNLQISRVKHNEFGFFSDARVYLRITRYELHFDVCAAPYGNTFFISWWLFAADGFFRTLLKFTAIGDFLTRRRKRKTFYQVDTENVFLSCCHECVLKTIVQLIDDKVHPLNEHERQYQMSNLST